MILNLKKYEEIHVNPWHQISHHELNVLYDNLLNAMNTTDEYSFKYFMDYLLKRLSGSEDAHTKYINLLTLFHLILEHLMMKY